MYACSYDKVLLVGDINAHVNETCISNFIYQNHLKNIVKEHTCFKNLENPTCIDLFLTNFPNSFQNTMAVSTGQSDFHKMIVTVLKNSFTKLKPKEIHYRCYKSFNRNLFRSELKLTIANISNYEEFESIYLKVLEKHAPFKIKTVCANQAPYMTKNLRKAIMRRSALKNKLYKYKTPEIKKSTENIRISAVGSTKTSTENIRLSVVGSTRRVQKT